MQVFYLKAEAKAELDKPLATLGDVAKVLCGDDRAQREAQSIVVYDFSREMSKAKVQRAVIDVMQLIALLQERFPGCLVKSLGETAVVIELRRAQQHPFLEKCKVGFIALLCFFGAAFTIMAFHNDIGIEDIFAEVYLLTTGMESDGFTVLEISYSVGLSVGILVFFNHIGTRRITKDPTPIEVQMRQYEGDVVTALVENADREAGRKKGQEKSGQAGTAVADAAETDTGKAGADGTSADEADTDKADMDKADTDGAGTDSAEDGTSADKAGAHKADETQSKREGGSGA